MKNFGLFLGIMGVAILIARLAAAADGKVEMDESDLSEKAAQASSRDVQPLKVQDTFTAPQRTINLRLIQSQVLNLNLSEKELEETDAPVEE